MDTTGEGHTLEVCPVLETDKGQNQVLQILQIFSSKLSPFVTLLFILNV
jgi:hypothetical protein